MERPTRHVAIAHSLIVMMTLLAACQPGPAPTPAPVASARQTASATMDPSETAAPMPTPAATDMPVHNPADATNVTLTPVASWQTYVYTAGVSIEYPSGWTASASAPDSGDDGMRFAPPAGDSKGVGFSVEDLPAEDKAMADPHTWVGNEAGYVVQWEKPITLANASGLMLVWGATADRQPDHTELVAVFYSEKYELEIQVWTFVDNQSLDLAGAAGFTDAVAARFGYFEHMARSIRIER